MVDTTESNSPNIHQRIETMDFGRKQTPISRELTSFYTSNSNNDHVGDSFPWNGIRGSDVDIIHPPPSLPLPHSCDSFSFPPPPPPGLRRPGPRRKRFHQIDILFFRHRNLHLPFPVWNFVVLFSVSGLLFISRRGLSEYAKASI